MQYYDFILLENLTINEETQLYLVKTGEKYTIRAISSGLEQLPSEPELRADGYWIIDSQRFFENLQDNQFQEFFVNDFLTPNQFTLEQINQYFDFDAVLDSINYKSFNPEIGDALIDEWSENINWDENIDDVIDSLVNEIPGFSEQDLRTLSEDNIRNLQKLFIGLRENLFTYDDIDSVNLQTLATFFSFDDAINYLRDRIFSLNDLDGIPQDVLVEALTNHLEDLRNGTYDLHQYLQMTNTQGAFAAVTSLEGQAAINEGLLSIEQIIDLTEYGKIHELLSIDGMQSLRDKTLTVDKIIDNMLVGVDDLINNLIVAIPGFDKNSLQLLPQEDILNLEKLLEGLEEGLFTSDDILEVNLETLVALCSFPDGINYIQEGTFYLYDLAGITQDMLVDILTNHVDELRIRMYDIQQYKEMMETPGAFAAVMSTEGRDAINDNLLTVQQIIDFTQDEKINEILSENCLQELRDETITIEELRNMLIDEITDRFANRTFQP